jgi:predicted transposase YbfD/YdcC
VVTIDAIGCQRDIASKIIEKKTDDYIIALKVNQSTWPTWWFTMSTGCGHATNGRARAPSSWSKAGANGKITNETRFYITSLVAPLIRAHWAIANSLDGVMDMVSMPRQNR